VSELAPQPASPRRVRVLTVSSNKGGVGKTTVATNLAIYFRALREDVPVLVVGLDDQGTIDRMFRLRVPEPGEGNLKHAFAERSLDRVIQLGQYGVHFVPSPPDLISLKARAEDPRTLERILLRTAFEGIVIFDTKSDLEALTQNALRAADQVLVPVADWASLEEASKLFALLAHDRRRSRARVLLTLADGRTRIDERGHDLRLRLETELDRRGFPRCNAWLSRSPRVEALNSGSGEPLSILHHAQGTNVHRQMRVLAEEVLGELEVAPAARPVAAADEAAAAPNVEALRRRRVPREPASRAQEGAADESGFDWKRAFLKGLRGW
jgi:cellulose biosynthesis protein BcsQ